MSVDTLTDTEKDGPLHRHRDGDNMWYIPPVTMERFISVTSVLDYAHKAALSDRWKPGLAARAALDELPRLIRASRIAPCGRTNSRCYFAPNGHDKRIRCTDCPCGECAPCLVLELQNTHFRESKRATDRGKAMHKVIEWWTLHGNLPTMADDIRPYANSFMRFVTDASLTPDSWEMAEATVLNRTDKWGGTLDGRVRFDATKGGLALKICKKFGLLRPLLSFDAKSREKEDASFFAEMALQLTAYRRGEVVLLDSGDEVPLGPDDGGLVVQIHQDGYHWRAVRTRDDEYRAFLGLLQFAYWSVADGDAATQVKTFPDLEIPGLPVPVKKTAAKRTPAKKTARKAMRGVALADVPEPDNAPTGTPLATVAANQSATLRSIRDWHTKPVHPNSPYGDDIPF